MSFVPLEDDVAHEYRVPLEAEGNALVVTLKDVQKRLRARSESWKHYTLWQWAASIFPGLDVMRNYKWKEDFLYDLLAGLSVAFMVVPQGMSYANLASLPAVYGLYGAFIPTIFYAFLGTSRQLAVGPVAVTSLLLGSGLDNIFGAHNTNPNHPANPELQEMMNHAAVQIAFLAGLLYTAVGIFNLGFLANFLSRVVVSGFMTGAAITIGLTQIKYVLGISMPRTDTLQSTIEALKPVIGKTSWREVLLSLLWFGILIACRQISRKFTRLHFLRAIGPITVVVLSLILMNTTGWYKHPSTSKPYIKQVGIVPSGLPPATIGWWFPLYHTARQIQLAVLIMVIDMCESLSIAKALAKKHSYELNTNKELRGLGVANIVGAMFNCYTTTGSFSRSAVNDSVGARTALSGFITGIALMFTLLWLTPLFTHLSASVQATVIIVGVYNLLEFHEFIWLVKVSPIDTVVWLTAFICVLLLGVELGLMIAIILSLAIVIYKTAFPRMTVLGRLKGTHLYRNLVQYSNVSQIPGLLVLRIDAPLYFANAEPVREWIQGLVLKGRDGSQPLLQSSQQQSDAESVVPASSETVAPAPIVATTAISNGETTTITQSDVPIDIQTDVRAIIIDLSPVTDIDVSAIHTLSSLTDTLKRENILLFFANPSSPVMTLLHRSGYVQKVGPESFHVNTHNAVVYAKKLLKQRAPVTLGNGGNGGIETDIKSVTLEERQPSSVELQEMEARQGSDGDVDDEDNGEEEGRSGKGGGKKVLVHH